MPKGKPYKRRQRKGYKPVSKLKTIAKSYNNRLGKVAGMNLISDFQVFLDPKLTAAPGSLQKAVTIQFAVNTLYPFLQASDQSFIIKDTAAVVNFDVPAQGYDRDAPNPTTASLAEGIYETEFSPGRKYEEAMITGASLEVYATPVALADGAGTPSSAQQAGLLTVCSHNGKTNPFNVESDNRVLKLIANRKTRRIEPLIIQGVANSKSKQTVMKMNVSIAKMNGVTDLNDNRDRFGFSLGEAGNTGVTAVLPAEINYVSINYMPALQANLTGIDIQAVPLVLRIRLKQRCNFYEPRSHSTIPGINWNVAKPFTLPNPQTRFSHATIALMAAAYARSRRYGGNGRAIMN